LLVACKYTHRDSKVGNFANFSAASFEAGEAVPIQMNRGDGTGFENADDEAGKKPTFGLRWV